MVLMRWENWRGLWGMQPKAVGIAHSSKPWTVWVSCVRGAVDLLIVL